MTFQGAVAPSACSPIYGVTRKLITINPATASEKETDQKGTPILPHRTAHQHITLVQSTLAPPRVLPYTFTHPKAVMCSPRSSFRFRSNPIHRPVRFVTAGLRRLHLVLITSLAFSVSVLLIVTLPSLVFL